MESVRESVRGRPARPLADRASTLGVCVAVFVATFVPAGAAAAVGGLWALTSVPWLAAAAAVAPLSVIAIWSAPRRLWPVYALACGGWLGASLWPMLCVGSFWAAVRLQRPPQLLAYIAGASATVLLPTTVGAWLGWPGFDWSGWQSSLGDVALFVVLPLFVGLWVNARRQVVEGLRERADQLEKSQAARAEQARAEERSRIAREMHDVVAHRVSLMVLHANAVEANTQDPLLIEEAALIRRTGREALAQLREVLGVLRLQRSEAELRPASRLSDLEALVQSSRAAGLDVRYRQEGQPRDLPMMVEHTAYRVVQEALTNVHKHAGAVATHVELRHRPEELEVVVSNAASTRAPEPLPGSGLGLVGLRERVELLRGVLSTGPTSDGGFTVRATLPTTPVDASDSDVPEDRLAVSDTWRPEV